MVLRGKNAVRTPLSIAVLLVFCFFGLCGFFGVWICLTYMNFRPLCLFLFTLVLCLSLLGLDAVWYFLGFALCVELGFGFCALRALGL